MEQEYEDRKFEESPGFHAENTILHQSEYLDRVEPLINWNRLIDVIERGNSTTLKRMIVEQNF